MDKTEKLTYLRSLAQSTVDACTITKPTSYSDEAETPLLLPSADEHYRSLWVRDCAMMAESGLVKAELLRKYVEIIAAHGQNGDTELELENGLRVPPYAVADHINYDGSPVFFPGTYNSGTNQGSGRFGQLPPLGDAYHFILLAYRYIAQTGDRAILDEKFAGIPLLKRLELAVKAYNVDVKTELCINRGELYAVDWGFYDMVRKSGYLLMPSILRFNAARALGELSGGKYAEIADKISRSIAEVFVGSEVGLLYSATELGRQPDVWATAYAIFSGALPRELEMSCANALRELYIAGRITDSAAVRQIPLGCDAREDSMWESTYCAHNVYQNGGFWHTATGWLYAALRLIDEPLAEGLMDDFIAHAKSLDGRLYEWIPCNGASHPHFKSGVHYGTSGVLPYIAYSGEPPRGGEPPRADMRS